MKRHKHLTKISFIILPIILLNIQSGCGKMYIEPEKKQEQKIDEDRKKLLERHQSVTAELKIIKDKLDEVTGKIYTLNTREKYGSKMPKEQMENKDENKANLDSAKIEAKGLQKKYDALSNELKEIEQNLKDLGYPVEKPVTQKNEIIIPAKTE